MWIRWERALKLGGLSLLQRYSREAGGGNAARHVQDECVYEYEGCWETRLVAAENPVVVASSCSAVSVEEGRVQWPT